MNDVLPTYRNPGLPESQSSAESFYSQYTSEFGECSPEAGQGHPRLMPVYNGKALELRTEFVHASLSGISIKHYYGKCLKEPGEEEQTEGGVLYGDRGTEGFDYDWFEVQEEARREEGSLSMKNTTKDHSAEFSGSSTSSGSFEYRDSVCVEGQPLCTLLKINYRNSFWNIHRPELCKLTWGQKYVGTSTVTEHLHEHLVQHGAVCVGFHTHEDRAFMLRKELDDYVSLKVVQESRKLPPDEPPFDFRSPPKPLKYPGYLRCKPPEAFEVKQVPDDTEMFLQLSDDEGNENRIRRSKEEFCLTIGRHIRRPPVAQEEEQPTEYFITPQLSAAEEEEVGGIFYYNWFLYNGEEAFEEESDNKVDSVSTSASDTEPMAEPCPPLMLDEFCRAAGKADFRDLRCDPDF